MSYYLNDSGKAGFKVSGKRTAKIILLTMLAICMVFGLSSCGGSTKGTKGTKETQIKDDVSKILSQDTALSGYNLKVSSVSISKRQTNAEDKTDFVWCDVAATGNAIRKTDDKFSCSIECKVTYVLYNDGWQLDTYTCDVVDSSIKPLSYPTKEQAEEAASKGNGMIPRQVEVHDMIQKSDTEVVYPVDRYYLYVLPLDRPYTLEDMTLKEGEIAYKFHLEYGWQRSDR